MQLSFYFNLFAGKELNEMEETITKKSSEIEALKAFLQEQKDEIQNLKKNDYQ